MRDVSLRQHVPVFTACGIAAISALLLFWQASSWLNSLLLLGNLAATGWLVRNVFLRSTLTEDDHDTPVTQNSSAQQLPDLLEHVLPVWSQHLDQVKQQSEQAIGQLIQSCSAMISAFDAAGFESVGNLGQAQTQSASITLLQLCKKELTPLIQSLQQVINGKDELLRCMRQLADATKELDSMTNEVSQIAATTNLLAINAAIEAARVGEHGRGFAVVAGEVRKLSHLSAETGRRMSERVKRISDVMHTSLRTADRAAINDGKILEVSGEVIKDVLSHVGEMADTSENMRIQGQVIRGHFEELIVSLQFQDRISQILQVVNHDIDKLSHEVGTGNGIMSAHTQQWLENLKTTYTMDDELKAHGQQNTAAAETEITFF
ncbi:methyl-accepting chemotaxis protein [Undibacterium squillarum]|uniref:methyl-accepting chemotaxis protein n=1 Tax=Undibacterium squillarum TaxID=1131567 RepID=UPI0035B103C9